MSTKETYQGDPKLYLDKNGAYLKYDGGQPNMDQGLENAAVISLLTEEGWTGNIFLKPESKIGSKFVKTIREPITLSGLNDDERAAKEALDKPFFGKVSVDINNPLNYRINTNILIEPPNKDAQVLNIEKNGENWLSQKTDPAYRR